MYTPAGTQYALFMAPGASVKNRENSGKVSGTSLITTALSTRRAIIYSYEACCCQIMKIIASREIKAQAERRNHRMA